MQRRVVLVLVLSALALSLVAGSALPAAAAPGFQAVPLAAGPSLERLAGRDRYATAAAVSRAGWPNGSDYVFIATGEDFPDSAVAAPLAGAYDAPLLLTRSDRLPLAAIAEIERLGATRAMIVGGVKAVSGGVAAQIRGLGITDVRRISGGDRYATAANVALHVAGLRETWGVVVATGTNHADSVSVSGLAAALHTPLLLTRPDVLPVSTAAAIKRIDPLGTLIVGSEGAVWPRVESKLPRVRRVGGADRYATALAVADLAEEAGFSPSSIVVASGVAYPDAIVSGPLAASLRAPLLLVRPTSVPDTTRAWLEARCSQVGRVRVVGGTEAISASTAAALRQATVTRMNPRARIADAALASLVTAVAADGSSITFSGWTDALRALVPGDILVFEASENVPDGFLGTVTRVEETGGQVVVFAGEASLSDVFEKAGVSYIVRSAEDAPVAGGAAVAAAGGAVVPAGFIGDAVDWVASAGSSLFDTFKDTGRSMWDLVYLLATGDYEQGFSVGGDDVRWTSPEIQFDDKDDGTPVGSMVASLRDEPTVRFGVLIEDYSLEYCGLYAFDYPILTLAADIVGEGSARKRVYTRDLGTKEVKVGAIKVPFHNYLHADLGMDVRETQGLSGLKLGCATAVVELESYVDGEGFHLGTGRSGPDYFEIPSGGEAFLDPNARFQGAEDFDVWMGIRLESLAYNTAGPFVDARARLNTKVDATASSADGAWRTVTAGLEADVGLHLKKIVDYEHTVTGIGLGSMVVHQDKGPFPAHVIDVARPAANNAVRVHLDGPGVLDASTVAAADFFSLPALTFVSAVPLGGDEFLLTSAQDLDRSASYDVYLKPRTVANTNGLLNTVQSAAGFDCAEAPGVLSAFWVNHDTIGVDFGMNVSEPPSPGPVVVTRRGTPVPVASQSWVTDTLYGRRFLTLRLASPFGAEPLAGEYALDIPFGCVLDADGYYSFGGVEPVANRWWALDVESVRAVDYSHVDIAFRPEWSGTCDLQSADATKFTVDGEYPVSVLGAVVLPDGVTVRLTTTKMPYTTGSWQVSLGPGAVTDATLRSSRLVSEQFDAVPRAALISVSAVDATHADLVFDGFGEISAISAAGIEVDGVASTGATVIGPQTVRVTTQVQHLGSTYSLVLAEGAVSDTAGTENAPASQPLSPFPSPEMRQAWATNQSHVRLDFAIAPGASLDPTAVDPSAFALESDVTPIPASVLGAAVDDSGRSVSIVTSGTIPFTAYRVVVSEGAVSDTLGRPAVSSQAAYEYSPPLVSSAEAIGPRAVWLWFELAPDRPVDPSTVQPSDFVVTDATSSQQNAVTAASVAGGGRGVLLTLAEDTSSGSPYTVSSAPDSFADSSGTWNRETEALFEGYDITLTKRSMAVSPGHDVSRLVVGDGGVLWAEHLEEHSPGDTDALAWWRPGSPVPFGVLTGGGEAGPSYAHKLSALGATSAFVPSGPELYVWDEGGQVSDPIVLGMPPSQMPYPLSADGGTVVYGGMGGGVMAVDTDTSVQTWIPAGGMLCEWPTISGGRIAWTVRNGPEREVWTADAASLEASRVAYADYDEPMASVSGTRIAYVREGDVFVFDVATSVETRLTATTQLESAAVLSGNRVVFERREDASSESSVWLVEVDTGFEKALSEGTGDARLPSISGDRVGFVATGSRGVEVWLLDVGTP